MKYGKIVKVKNKFVSLDTIILPPPQRNLIITRGLSIGSGANLSHSPFLKRLFRFYSKLSPNFYLKLKSQCPLRQHHTLSSGHSTNGFVQAVQLVFQFLKTPWVLNSYLLFQSFRVNNNHLELQRLKKALLKPLIDVLCLFIKICIDLHIKGSGQYCSDGPGLRKSLLKHRLFVSLRTFIPEKHFFCKRFRAFHRFSESSVKNLSARELLSFLTDAKQLNL